MQYEIANRTDNFQVTDDVQAVFESEVDKLRKITEGYPDDALLRIILEDGGNSAAIAIQLRLSIPGHMLVSHESHKDMRAAIEIAFKELRRQILDHKRDPRDRQRARG